MLIFAYLKTANQFFTYRTFQSLFEPPNRPLSTAVDLVHFDLTPWNRLEIDMISFIFLLEKNCQFHVNLSAQ